MGHKWVSHGAAAPGHQQLQFWLQTQSQTAAELQPNTSISSQNATNHISNTLGLDITNNLHFLNFQNLSFSKQIINDLEEKKNSPNLLDWWWFYFPPATSSPGCRTIGQWNISSPEHIQNHSMINYKSISLQNLGEACESEVKTFFSVFNIGNALKSLKQWYRRVFLFVFYSKQLNASSGPQFNLKMTSYQYRKSHCGAKMILRPSHLHNGISYTGKRPSLYWIGALTGGPPPTVASNPPESLGTNQQLHLVFISVASTHLCLIYYGTWFPFVHSASRSFHHTWDHSSQGPFSTIYDWLYRQWEENLCM